MASSTPQIQLPGFNVPLELDSPDDELFPNALEDTDEIARIKTLREIIMMRTMNTITDKPDWETKVHNEEITTKWRQELLASGQDISPKMIDFIIQELQYKAAVYQKFALVDVYDGGVVKSDVAVSEEEKRALREAAAPLEKIEPRDYHPGSGEKVVDLVHPSLFPVIYGRTRVLPDRTIGRNDCMASIGEGELLPVPSDDDAGHSTEFIAGQLSGFNRYSQKFQWMPCDVEFTEDGCRIASYINNLHPFKHRDLYGAIEKIMTKTIPLWERTLRMATSAGSDRIHYDSVEYLGEEEPEQEEGEVDELYWERMDEWWKIRPIKQPEPGNFGTPAPPSKLKSMLRDKFHKKGLQVIVKLANIELTPENPEYEGGTWHLEGQLNERICATAIYYYDSANITESTLSFRHRVNAEALEEISYEQSRHEFLQQIYGLTSESYSDPEGTQTLGSVVSREGRLLTFPNILQHRVSPFELADRTKPGHRKILALFLVDPHVRVISSANVPPQQGDWAKEHAEAVREVLDPRLPIELREMVKGHMPDTSISWDEAKQFRLELMEERSARSQHNNDEFESVQVSLCEH